MSQGNDDGQTTGLPGLRTWRAVYMAVSAIFVFWVAALVLLARFYS